MKRCNVPYVMVVTPLLNKMWGYGRAKENVSSDSSVHWRAVQEQARVFVESVRQYMEERPDEVGAAAFDKEDALAVDFVMAAANLRAAAYGIPMQTWFAIKVRPAGVLANASFADYSRCFIAAVVCSILAARKG